MSAEDASADAVIDAYRRFRAADTAMLARIRNETRMSDNELGILRFLVQEADRERDVTPREISRHLGISSASTTALIDRLERSGMVERFSHPTDRRSILIAATRDAEGLVAETLESFENRIVQLTEDMNDQERRDVVAFLNALAESADATASAPSVRMR